MLPQNLKHVQMKKTLKIILQVFRKKKVYRNHRHLRNIEKGEKIEIDGKEYVKVKLKFVDTMDFNLARHVDNLESENNLLQREVLKLNEQAYKNNIKIEQLQLCTKNVIQESARLKDQNQKDQKQKDVFIAELTKQINEQIEKNEEQKNIINDLSKNNFDRDVEYKRFQKTEKILNDRIKLLEKKISKLTLNSEKDQDTILNLNKKNKRSEKAYKEAKKELNNNKELNKTLTERVFNQKNAIDSLNERLKAT
jgi:chromosome segregation ATPase